MPKLDLSPLDDLFSKGEDFELTAAQYEERVGRALPTTTAYIKRSNSPLARKAKEKGYTIDSVTDKPVIMKTVIFKKK